MCHKLKKQKLQEIKDESGDLVGLAVKEKEANPNAYFGPDFEEWYVFCRYPEDAIPHMGNLIPGISLDQAPRGPHKEIYFNYEDGNVFGTNMDVIVLFICQDHDGISAILWYSRIIETLSKSDLKKLDDFLSEMYA